MGVINLAIAFILVIVFESVILEILGIVGIEGIRGILYLTVLPSSLIA